MQESISLWEIFSNEELADFRKSEQELLTSNQEWEDYEEFVLSQDTYDGDPE